MNFFEAQCSSRILRVWEIIVRNIVQQLTFVPKCGVMIETQVICYLCGVMIETQVICYLCGVMIETQVICYLWMELYFSAMTSRWTRVR